METQTAQSTPLPRLSYSLAEIEAMCGLSRSSLYRLIAAGRLKTVHCGRRRLVPTRELTKLLEPQACDET